MHAYLQYIEGGLMQSGFMVDDNNKMKFPIQTGAVARWWDEGRGWPPYCHWAGTGQNGP